MKSPPPVTITLCRSRIARAAIALAYGATASLIAMLPGPLWLRAAGVIGICAAGAWALRGLERQPGIDIAIGLDRGVSFTRAGCVEAHGTVLGDSYVAPGLTTIVWQPEHARLPRTVLIVRDAVEPESFRQLRVALRYASPRPAEGGTSALDAG